jgi:hypothetical protein
MINPIVKHSNKILENKVDYGHDGYEYIFNNVYLNSFLNIKRGRMK